MGRLKGRVGRKNISLSQKHLEITVGVLESTRGSDLYEEHLVSAPVTQQVPQQL